MVKECKICGALCSKVGEKNREGETKDLCCRCYELSSQKEVDNPLFSVSDYCPPCLEKYREDDEDW